MCTCEDPEVLRMSWERIQKGFAALEESSGPSPHNPNPFGLGASRFNDPVVANQIIQRIGYNWDPEVWGSEQYFNQVKDWAANVGPLEERSRSIMREAEANEKLPEGASYKSQVADRFSGLVQSCRQSPNADVHKFAFMLMIGKDDTPQNGFQPPPE